MFHGNRQVHRATHVCDTMHLMITCMRGMLSFGNARYGIGGVRNAALNASCCSARMSVPSVTALLPRAELAGPGAGVAPPRRDSSSRPRPRDESSDSGADRWAAQAGYGTVQTSAARSATARAPVCSESCITPTPVMRGGVLPKIRA
jgi:hypothetical protein